MLVSKLLRYRISYETAFKLSVNDPIYYWKHQASKIKWETFPSTTLRVDDLHFHRWFPDGRLNISEQCIDRHLQDRASQVVYHYESPITQ